MVEEAGQHIQNEYKPKTFEELITNFRKYKGDASVDGNAKNETHLEESNKILGA